MWAEVDHQGHWLWGFPGGTGEGQLLPVFCPGPPSMNYKVICRWLLLVLGLEVPRQDQAVNQEQLLLVPGLGPLSMRYRACWGQMLLIWEILGKSKVWAKIGHFHGKPPETVWVGLQVGWDWVSGNYQGGENSVSQLDGDSGMVPACQLSGQRAHQRNNGLASTLFLAESCTPLQLLPWCQMIQFLPVCSWCLLSCCHSFGAQRERVWVHPCPLKGITWDSRSFCLTQPQSHWFLQPEVMGTSLLGTETLGWGVGSGCSGVGLGPFTPQGGPPQLRYPSWFLSATGGYGTSLFRVSAFPTSLDVASFLNP